MGRPCGRNQPDRDSRGERGVRLGGAGRRLSRHHDEGLPVGRQGLQSGGSFVARPRAGRMGRADRDSGGRGRRLSDSGDVFPSGRDAAVRGKCKKTGLPTMALVGIGSKKQIRDGANAADMRPQSRGRRRGYRGDRLLGDPDQMLPTALEMREAVDVPIACQPKGFRQGRIPGVSYAVRRHRNGVTPDEMAAFALKALRKG